MVLPRGGGHEETLALLYRIREELAEEVVLDGVSLSVAASFGVCFYPQSAETVEDLLQHADAAMYRGKQGQPNQGGIVIYEAAMAHHPTHALLIQRELRGALDRDELVLHYQPKVTLSSGRVTCLEALVRWQHPARGLLLPSEFLSAAESCEVIEPLTSWVLRRALSDYLAWTAAGHDWMVAVNVSARNLRSPEFAGSVAQILLEANVPPRRLHLEVSETALAFDVELARTAIGPLIEQGISVALDHFGMDRTDLAQLLNAGVSEIKMDRTFLADLPGNERDRATVRSVITLGHALGCRVTAQGVESREVAEVLEDAGCDEAQGYLWLHPGPWSGVARAFGTAEKPADTAVTPSQTTRGGLRTSR
jgi:EAL domain-containing protein (putative c-di-GMP-specific phosphodiesterase class I)